MTRRNRRDRQIVPRQPSGTATALRTLLLSSGVQCNLVQGDVSLGVGRASSGTSHSALDRLHREALTSRGGRESLIESHELK